jgi:PKD repeat protein
VSTNPSGLPVDVIYNGSPTAPIQLGSYSVTATVNDPNYTGSSTATLLINDGSTIFLSNLSQTYNGSPRPVSIATNPAGLTYTVTYNGSTIAPTNAGSYTVVATVTNPGYSGSVTGTLVINKATPIITWSTPASIPYGTPLSAAQLNATSNVAGTFIYLPAAGTVFHAGTQTLNASFTPGDQKQL